MIRPSARVSRLERTLIRQIFESAPPDAINFGLGQPDLPTPPALALAGIDGITRGRTGYTATAGDVELRRRIAALYPGHASGVDDVIVTVGSQEAMFAACLALLDPGDEVLFPDPGYPAYPVVARLCGAEPVPYPLRPERRFRLDADDVLERLGPRTRAVILCSPSNPTGACAERAELERLVAELGRREVPWISDELYAQFDWDGRFVTPAALAPGGGLIVSSLSKDVSMAGWRVGWVVAPTPVAQRLVAVHQCLVTCAPAISQHAALAVFSAEGAAARREVVERFRRRRALMAEGLERIPGARVEPPDGAFYFFLDVSRHGDALELARRLIERRRVVTIPGAAFGATAPGYLRLSFAADEAAIVEGTRRIAEELGRG